VVKLRQSTNNRLNTAFKIGAILLGCLVLNLLASKFYLRFDLTKENRYSISEPTKQLLNGLEDDVFIKVYLEGSFPAGFVRLKSATEDMLKEFRLNGGQKVEFVFVDPLASNDPDERKNIKEELEKKGLTATTLMESDKGSYAEKIIFPGAIVNYRGRELPVQLLENQVGFEQEEILNNSIILLEYKFANAIKKLTRYRAPLIAFTSGNGELSNERLGDLSRTLSNLLYKNSRLDLGEYYKVPKEIDVLVIAKPTKPFDEKDKFKIDQYLMNGGKLLWFIDQVKASMDSLKNKEMFMAMAEDYNIDDMLFKYGVRVNYDLIQDHDMCNPIPLVVGQVGNSPQTQLFPWYFHPLLVPSKKHAIVKNLDPVAGRFASTLDTIRVKGIKKTILLHTSEATKAVLAPTRIQFSMLKEKPNRASFRKKNVPAAVLLEGSFPSVFKGRMASSFLQSIDSSEELTYIENSAYTRMIVVSDGDIAANDLRQAGGIYPLGFNRYTNITLSNRDFILNSLEYLLDDNGLIETRNKEIKLRLLDKEKLANEKLFWQLFNMLLPLVLIVLFGLIYSLIRQKRFSI